MLREKLVSLLQKCPYYFLTFIIYVYKTLLLSFYYLSHICLYLYPVLFCPHSTVAQCPSSTDFIHHFTFQRRLVPPNPTKKKIRQIKHFHPYGTLQSSPLTAVRRLRDQLCSCVPQRTNQQATVPNNDSSRPVYTGQFCRAIQCNFRHAD